MSGKKYRQKKREKLLSISTNKLLEYIQEKLKTVLKGKEPSLSSIRRYLKEENKI